MWHRFSSTQQKRRDPRSLGLGDIPKATVGLAVGVGRRNTNVLQGLLVKRLEDQFGTALFDRSQRRLALTPDGERLLGHAARILGLGEEIRGLMTSRGLEGGVRLGVPHDLISFHMPWILRGFAKAFPKVEISLVCSHTTALLHDRDQGGIDVILTTEDRPNHKSQLLGSDQLVWAGAPSGTAHERSPLPITLGDDECTFRAAAVKALGAQGRDWRFTCVSSNFSAFRATLEADLAIAPLLSRTVPEALEILGPESGLPNLPTFFINLYVAPVDPSALSLELARHITRGFATRALAAA